MKKAVKTLQIELGPAPALESLLRLRAASEAPRWPFSARLRDALAGEWRRVEGQLASLAVCLDWFHDRGYAALLAARVRRARQRPLYHHALAVELDVASVLGDLALARGAACERAQVTVAALGTLLQYLREGSLVCARAVRANRSATTVPRLASAIEAMLARAGYVLTTKPTRAAKAAATAEVPPAEAPHAAPRARGARAKTQTFAAGFGGLPDDAEPEDRSAPKPAMGPRGLSLDAEFFLEHAEIAGWPCAPAELERGRKRALARLHPDRMGEGATPLFQRATRGHAELARLLSRVKTAAPAAHAATADPVRPPAESSVGTRAAPPPAAPTTATADARRRTAGSTADPGAPASGSAGATTVGEWPPRPAPTATPRRHANAGGVRARAPRRAPMATAST